MKPNIFNSDHGMLEVCFCVSSLLGQAGWQPASKHPQGTAVSGVGLLGNAVQPATGLWCTGNTCPQEAAGGTGDPKHWLHLPWFRASCSCVQVPFTTGWTRAKARIWCLSLVVCHRLGALSLTCWCPYRSLICSRAGLPAPWFCSCLSCNNPCGCCGRHAPPLCSRLTAKACSS